jgi:hypothetical protein
MIEIDKRIRGPDFFAQLVACNDLTGILQQGNEHLKRLFLEPYAGAVLAQFSGVQVDFKNAEAQQPGFVIGGRHRHGGAPVVYTARNAELSAGQSSLFAVHDEVQDEVHDEFLLTMLFDPIFGEQCLLTITSE